MTEYVKHKLNLRRKLMAKRKLKDPVSSNSVSDDPAIISNAPSLVDPSVSVDAPPVSIDPPAFDERVDAKLSDVKTELVGQFRSLFSDFAKSVEVKFSIIDQKFSQVMPATSNVDRSDLIGSDSCQPGC